MLYRNNVIEIEFDAADCTIGARSNEDIVHDSKVGRLVSNKNEWRGSFLTPELQVFIWKKDVY